MTGRMGRLAAPLCAAAVVAACTTSPAPPPAGAPRGGLAASMASFDLAVGPPSRVIVGLFAADERPVGYGTVEMRFCYLGTAQVSVACRLGPPSTGTFLPIPGSTTPTPRPTTPALVDAAAGRGVYAAIAGFDRAGFWQVQVTATIAGRPYAATATFDVGAQHLIRDVGDSAFPTANLTVTTPGAAPAAIDSRASSLPDVPDADLHRTTIAAALGAHRPAVVVFATPVFCVSRFCGPVTDMVAGVAHDFGDRASFVHVEIWQDHQNQKVNAGAAQWLLQPDGDLHEPWVFVIGADGKIVARFDDVATREELEPLLRQLPVIGPAS